MKEEEKKEKQEVQGPGRILREERERRGLTYQDMSETTRLRPSIIKAIENEDWDSLPSPAFARGFLKTYAKALYIDAARILEAYGREPVLDGELLRTPPEPLRRRRKGPFFLLCIFAAVAVFALWKTYGPPERPLTRSQVPVVAEPEKDAVDAVAEISTTAPVPQSAEEQSVVSAVPSSVSSPEIVEETAQESPAPEPATATPGEPAPTVGPHMLKGKINARTWVKIYVDDLNPREYMFQPGQQPEWTASKGFYLIIGNAGGIDLEWNGREVTLGNAGQVVRKSLPEDFRHRVEGN